MLKNYFILFIFILSSLTNAMSQSNYYWYNDEQIYLEPYHKKKYIVVDSTITSESELINSLNNPNLTVNTFQECSVLIHLNIYDSTAYEKQYAIIQSQDSIDESELIDNPVVNYVGPYYISQSSGDTVGISRLFYVKLNQESDIALLDSMSNSNNVTILGNDSDMPLIYTLECSNQSTGNALDMANLFYESNYFEHSAPSFTESVNTLSIDYCDLKSKEISIYPNPTKDFLYVEGKFSKINIKEINIYSMSGGKIKSYPPNSDKLNIKELRSGFYILSISIENKNITYKIIKI